MFRLTASLVQVKVQATFLQSNIFKSSLHIKTGSTALRRELNLVDLLVLKSSSVLTEMLKVF